MRMGIHTGSVVAGVVGTKIPHYSVFGETVEIAGIMECSGESMKIQVFFNRFSAATFCIRDALWGRIGDALGTHWGRIGDALGTH